MLPWRRCLLAAATLACLTLAACLALAPRRLDAAPAPQAGTLAIELTKTLQGADVVRVGQLLTFTIRLHNTGTISITAIPLIDEYNAAVLRLERTAPLSATNMITPSVEAGAITWTALPTATVGGPLVPGASFEVVTVFRAIAPRETTVNRARTGTLLGWGGASGAGGSSEDRGSAEGGQVIVAKKLAPNQTPRGGQPITFTVAITNDGAADVVRLPLEDIYSTTHLLFWRAEPPPTAVETATGRLVWDDALPGLGLSRLRPNQVVTVTTVFTALRALDGGVANQARALDVRDEFGNEVVAPRRADVPIRILPAPTEQTPAPATATTRPEESRRRTPTETPAPTTTLAPTEATTATAGFSPTLGVTATTTISAPAVVATPAALPRTGAAGGVEGLALVALALIATGALGVFRWISSEAHNE